MRVILFAVVVAFLLAFASAQQAQVGSLKCTACTHLVSLLKDNLTKYNGTITEVFKKQVCGRLGKFQTQCNKFTDAYGPQALALLAAKINPQAVCKTLTLCDRNEWFALLFTEQEAQEFVAQMEKAEQPKEVAIGSTCDVCQYVVKVVEKLANDSETQIEKKALELCKLLPGQAEQFCDTIVLVYGHQIIQYVINKYTPQQICQLIGLCKNSTTVAQKPVEVVEAAPANDNCELCKFFVNTIEQFLADNKTETQIIAGLEKICAVLPGAYSSQCKLLVDQYLPYVIYYVNQQFPPEKVCTYIQQCKAVAAPANLDKCAVCELVVELAEHAVGTNATKAQIVAALNKGCSFLPGSVGQQCTALIATFGDQIADYIVNKTSPQAVCKLVGLCSKNEAILANENFPVTAAKVSVNDATCDTCVQVVTFIENYIQSNTTSQKIIEALNKACDVVPDQYKLQCKLLVPLVWAEIVQALQTKEPPKTVCQQLKLCPKQTFNSATLCAGCKTVVSIAHNWIAQNSTISEITSAVEQACNYFPEQYQGLCRVVIDQYGPAIIQQLDDKILDADKVCNAVHLCSNVSQAEETEALVQMAIH